MKFIIGLGNPGRDYAGTRHNIGFEVIDRIAADVGVEINRAKHRAHFGEGFLGTRKIVLVKPQTYMNLSGECVRDILHFYKRTPSDMIVVYDDCDLALGQIRIRERGSAGSHNGMKNIVYQLETDEFVRVRVGIGEKPPRMELANYVLSKFAKHELEEAAAGAEKAADAAIAVLKEGATAAMNKFNVKAGG
ncbi:MAG: aminoacyl-tRNA hydrolase [Defluviitaleaceae bacterium]|nr:aminoacyl-tRNA hydrolase [Defluviitaleaceae bacterium]